MAYDKPKANEWIRPVKEGYKMACCDCGLVHEMDFRIEDERVEFRVRRHNRATAGIRVRMGFRKGKDGIWRVR